MNWIGKRLRTKICDAEEDDKYGQVTHPIGSTFVVTQQIQGGLEPMFMVAWEQALDSEGNAVPAEGCTGMWTSWTEDELINDAEIVGTAITIERAFKSDAERDAAIKRARE